MRKNETTNADCFAYWMQNQVITLNVIFQTQYIIIVSKRRVVKQNLQTNESHMTFIFLQI